MSAPPKPDPEAHLVALCDRLDLEPVIRHMRQSKHLSYENAQLVRSHPTSHLRIEALVNLLNSEERIADFMLALWATGQTDLAELIDPPSDPTMTASRSQPSLPSPSAAASAAQSSEAAESPTSSSSQAEVLQLPAELDALILRRVCEALSSSQLVGLKALGGSEAQEAPSSSGLSPTKEVGDETLTETFVCQHCELPICDYTLFQLHSQGCNRRDPIEDVMVRQDTHALPRHNQDFYGDYAADYAQIRVLEDSANIRQMGRQGPRKASAPTKEAGDEALTEPFVCQHCDLPVYDHTLFQLHSQGCHRHAPSDTNH